MLLYSLVKFKARKGAVPAQIRGNTRLEIGWTVGAAVILVVLATLTFVKLDGIRNPPDSVGRTASSSPTPARRLPPERQVAEHLRQRPAVHLALHLRRRTARPARTSAPPFSYEEMVVPVDTTVTLDINAQDVAHSWWIPKLGGKIDAIPGYTNHTWFKVPGKFGEKPGGTVFFGQCAELCGRNHANMTARVRAVSVAEYQQWLAQRKADIKSAEQAGRRSSARSSDAQHRPRRDGQNPGARRILKDPD